jgi:mono/diheme cytochrome c family protein
MERKMIMNSKYLFPVFVAVAYAALAQATAQSNTPPTQKTNGPAAAQVSKQHQDEGTRIFLQNCSRCHNSPEGFSPHISGTIVRHMRVRASLSKHDEDALLRFFNP